MRRSGVRAPSAPPVSFLRPLQTPSPRTAIRGPSITVSAWREGRKMAPGSPLRSVRGDGGGTLRPGRWRAPSPPGPRWRAPPSTHRPRPRPVPQAPPPRAAPRPLSPSGPEPPAPPACPAPRIEASTVGLPVAAMSRRQRIALNAPSAPASASRSTAPRPSSARSTAAPGADGRFARLALDRHRGADRVAENMHYALRPDGRVVQAVTIGFRRQHADILRAVPGEIAPVGLDRAVAHAP